MKDCIFCKIIDKQIPCYKIYEDENTLAFLDISNDVYGHTLVIPKNHSENILQCEELASIMAVVKKISNHYINSCGFEGVQVINNCGEAAGQSVMHIHFHILPRKKKVVPKAELEEVCKALKLN